MTEDKGNRSIRLLVVGLGDQEVVNPVRKRSLGCTQRWTH